MARKVSPYSPHIIVNVDDEDRALINALIEHEKLTRSDIVRRALRAYAKQLGIEPARAT
jgi:metal-responsive CopG/Arc/MetJ family transcriptional regulator